MTAYLYLSGAALYYIGWCRPRFESTWLAYLAAMLWPVLVVVELAAIGWLQMLTLRKEIDNGNGRTRNAG